MGVLVYGVEVGGFLCGSSYGSSGGSMVWVFPMGLLVRLGLRYRLLWFWVFGWVFPRILPMDVGLGLGLRYRLLWFGC